MEAVKISHELAVSIPYIEDLFVTVLKGALKTWSASLPNLWMGALSHPRAQQIVSGLTCQRLTTRMKVLSGRTESSFVTIPHHPSIISNARFMYLRNGTKGFMETMLSSPDFEKFLRRMWREIDRSKLESKRKADLVEESKKVLQDKKVKNAARAVRKAAASAKVNAVDLTLEEVRH